MGKTPILFICCALWGRADLWPKDHLQERSLHLSNTSASPTHPFLHPPYFPVSPGQALLWLSCRHQEKLCEVHSVGTFLPDRLLLLTSLSVLGLAALRGCLAQLVLLESLLKWISQVSGRSYLQSLVFKGKSKEADSWGKSILGSVLNCVLTWRNLHN